MATAAIATLAGRRSRLVSSKHNDEQVLKRPLVSFVHGIWAKLPRGRSSSGPRWSLLRRARGRRSGEDAPDLYGIDPEPLRAAAMPFELRRRGSARASASPRTTSSRLRRAVRREGARGPARGAREGRAPRRPASSSRRRRSVRRREEEGRGGRARPASRRARGLHGHPARRPRAPRDLRRLRDGLALGRARPGVPRGDGRVAPRRRDARLGGSRGRLRRRDGAPPPSTTRPRARGAPRLAEEPDLRRGLGRAGARRVRERFGLERMVEETLAVYGEVRG
jgi:hypothetical protein